MNVNYVSRFAVTMFVPMLMAYGSLAAEAGANEVIANGRKAGILEGVLAGRDIGTFVPGRAL